MWPLHLFSILPREGLVDKATDGLGARQPIILLANPLIQTGK